MNDFNCQYCFIQNPQTGLLKNQDFMDGIPYCDVDYCTDLITENAPAFGPT